MCAISHHWQFLHFSSETLPTLRSADFHYGTEERSFANPHTRNDFAELHTAGCKLSGLEVSARLLERCCFPASSPSAFTEAITTTETRKREQERAETSNESVEYGCCITQPRTWRLKETCSDSYGYWAVVAGGTHLSRESHLLHLFFTFT